MLLTYQSGGGALTTPPQTTRATLVRILLKTEVALRLFYIYIAYYSDFYIQLVKPPGQLGAFSTAGRFDKIQKLASAFTATEIT